MHVGFFLHNFSATDQILGWLGGKLCLKQWRGINIHMCLFPHLGGGAEQGDLHVHVDVWMNESQNRLSVSLFCRKRYMCVYVHVHVHACIHAVNCCQLQACGPYLDIVEFFMNLTVNTQGKVKVHCCSCTLIGPTWCPHFMNSKGSLYCVLFYVAGES